MFKKFLIIAVILFSVTLVSGCSKQEENINQNAEEQISQENQAQNDNTAEEQEETVFVGDEINMANWQTYRNEEYGFYFKYPNDWVVDVDGLKAYVYSRVMRDNMPEGGGAVIVSIENLDLREFIENYEVSDAPHSKIIKQEKYSLDNFPATILEAKTAIGINQNIIFVSNKNNYTISFHNFDEYHLAIISTFKFVK